jgi:ribose 5-phosphate isomerase B
VPVQRPFISQLTREHNDTNMLAMGAFIVGEKLAQAIAEEWLSTPFSNEERHKRRIRKIAQIENDAIK